MSRATTALDLLGHAILPTARSEQVPCPACGAALVHTTDAIGRVKSRCPRCEGVATHRPHHPDDVLVPQTLVRASAAQLPPVRPGQLRCQRCARGVEGRRRFCEPCAREMIKASHRRTWRKRHGLPDAPHVPLQQPHRSPTFTPKPCRVCGHEFQPTGPNSQHCPACRAARTA